MPRSKTGWIGKRKDRAGLWARITYLNDEGKRKPVWRKVENRTEGQRVINQLLRKFEDHGPRLIEGERMTFNDLADIYEKEKLIAPVYKRESKIKGMRSWQSQRTYLKALREGFGKKALRDIRDTDLVNYKAERADSLTVRGAERSITSVNRELQLMRAMLIYAVGEGWLKKSPFKKKDGLISKADEHARERILTREEEERLIEACAGPRAHLRPLLIAALDTGMRKGELLKLIWESVNLERGLIEVKKTTTKTWEERTVGMTERLRAELRRLKELAPPDSKGRVFGIASDFKRSFATACELANVEDFHFHDCRHTATTRMIQAGMPPTEVMKITGHKQMSTFLRYLNTDHQTATRAAGKLDDWHAQVEPERWQEIEIKEIA